VRSIHRYIGKEEKITTYALEINHAALTLELMKAEECAKEIDRILEEVYSDIKNMPLFRKIKAALVEASKKIIKIKHERITKKVVKNYTNMIENLKELIKEIDNGVIMEGIRRKKKEIGKKLAEGDQSTEPDSKVSKNVLTCRYTATKTGSLEPEWNPKRDSIEIPIQETIKVKPNETKIVVLGIEIETTKDLETEVRQPEGWDKNIELIINTALVRNKHEEGEKISIQNISDEVIKYGEDTKLVEVVIRNRKKLKEPHDWEELKEREIEKEKQEENSKLPEIKVQRIDQERKRKK
jgi:dUTPase/copper chaperone CopZ